MYKKLVWSCLVCCPVSTHSTSLLRCCSSREAAQLRVIILSQPIRWLWLFSLGQIRDRDDVRHYFTLDRWPRTVFLPYCLGGVESMLPQACCVVRCSGWRTPCQVDIWSMSSVLWTSSFLFVTFGPWVLYFGLLASLGMTAQTIGRTGFAEHLS